MYVDDCVELKVLTDYFSRLTSILRIDTISHKLISARIIAIADLEEIEKLTSKDKAIFVLKRINSSLNGGIATSFYSLLEVMEECDGDDVASLANEIRRSVNKSGDL